MPPNQNRTRPIEEGLERGNREAHHGHAGGQIALAASWWCGTGRVFVHFDQEALG